MDQIHIRRKIIADTFRVQVRRRSTKFMMAESQFDIEKALADARLPMLPHDIPRLVENEADEHEDIVAGPAPAPAPAPTVPQLALELANFQEAERRVFGGSTPDRRQEIIPELNAEDYMDSDTDEEYPQDDEEDEELNEGDSIMELDPGLPPPANDAGRGSPPNLQVHEAEHGVHGEHRSERPYLTTVGFIVNVLEVVAEVQYCDSDLPDQAADPGNTKEESVPAKHSPLFSTEALSTELQGPNSDPTPVIEEGHVHEIIKLVNPSSSRILTLAASMTPKTLLPGTSDTLVLCESTLEPATSSAANGRISDGDPTQKLAANIASVCEGESLMKPAV